MKLYFILPCLYENQEGHCLQCNICMMACCHQAFLNHIVMFILQLSCIMILQLYFILPNFLQNSGGSSHHVLQVQHGMPPVLNDNGRKLLANARGFLFPKSLGKLCGHVRQHSKQCQRNKHLHALLCSVITSSDCQNLLRY